MYEESLVAEYASIDPESQSGQHSYYLSWICLVSIFGAFYRLTWKVWKMRIIQHLTKDIVKDTFTKVINAPINLFFDVTPLGKIIQIFNHEIDIFSDRLFEPLIEVVYHISHILLVVKLMLQIGGLAVIMPLAFTCYLAYLVSVPYFCCDNQCHKVGSILYAPVHSYFYECMRGTSVIRAFG